MTTTITTPETKSPASLAYTAAQAHLTEMLGMSRFTLGANWMVEEKLEEAKRAVDEAFAGLVSEASETA